MSTRTGLRLKTFWFKDQRARDPNQIATATAAVLWRGANHRIQNLRNGKFNIDAGPDYANVLVELLCLMVVVADRIAYRQEAAPWREQFTGALAHRVGELLQDSLDDLIGPDPDPARGWRRRFIDRVNARIAEYAAHDYGPDGPDFGFLRHFGDCLTEMLPDADDRRWSCDQAMTVEGPEIVDMMEKSLSGLLGLAPKPPRRAAGGAD
ncbi:MAG: hypothetical protein H6934_07765 [Burkholderiaceae bacterium]|nr:hypothetical protein [Burkholderiaceae bacterium]